MRASRNDIYWVIIKSFSSLMNKASGLLVTRSNKGDPNMLSPNIGYVIFGPFSTRFNVYLQGFLCILHVPLETN